MATEFDKYKIPQKFFENDYLSMLKNLFPTGFIWKFGLAQLDAKIQDVIGGIILQDVIGGTVLQDSINGSSSGNLFSRLLSCFAKEFEELEALAWDILAQTDPGVATDLLEDWERVLGLPGECDAEQVLTVEERQRRARAKLFDTFVTTTEQAFIDYAATLGFEITVSTNVADYAPRIMGVARMGVERMTGRGGYSVVEITVVDDGGQDLEVLQCALAGFKPAHVLLVYVT